MDCCSDGEKKDYYFLGGRTSLKEEFKGISKVWKRTKELPFIQHEIIQCKDCKYWNSGSCECREHVVNCQDYMVGDMETEAEHFCGYAERRGEIECFGQLLQ